MNKIFMLALCLLTFVAYSNSLSNNFVLDDKVLVLNNPLGKSLKLMPLIFKQSLYDHWVGVKLYDRMYRPMQLLVYWFVYNIWGLNPLGYHLVSIMLHLFNSILIYYLLFSLFADYKISAITSILFLVHPIYTSVVSYIASSADLLSCLFMVLSAILFLKFLRLKGKGYYFLSLLSAIFALLSRENALILFMFIWLIIFIKKPGRKYYFFIVPFILLNLFYLVLRFFILGESGLYTHPVLLTFPLHLVNFFNIIFRYIGLLLLPLGLRPLRVTPFIKDFLDLRAFLALGFILLYIFTIVRLQKNKIIVFSMVWFFIGLLPVFLSLDGYPMLEGAMMAESWLYVPSIGFFIILARIINSIRKPALFILFFVVFYGVLTIINNTYWRNDIVIQERIIGYTSEKNILRKDLIESYLENGRYPEALAEIKKFSNYYSHTSLVDVVWGNYYFFTSQPELAIERYNKAIIRNKHFFLYYRLAASYGKMRQLEKAIDCGLESLRLNRNFVPNLTQLGDLYAQKKQFNEAKIYYQMAYDLEPHNKTIKDLINNAN
jgi:tetratricopeptide (TPR) repeat protein